MGRIVARLQQNLSNDYFSGDWILMMPLLRLWEWLFCVEVDVQVVSNSHRRVARMFRAQVIVVIGMDRSLIHSRL